MDDTPVETKEPKVIDISKLRQKPVDRSAPRAAVHRSKSKPKAPIYQEPPRGQFKGPIVNRPADWIVCTTCSKLFSTPEKQVRYGIRPRHAAKHLNDHKMGRIRRPVEAK